MLDIPPSAFKKAFTSLLIATGLTTAQSATAEPTITIEHPPQAVKSGGERIRQVDCSAFNIKRGKLELTCDAARQIDPQNTDFCIQNDSNLLLRVFGHFARTHHDCTHVYVDKILRPMRKDPDKIMPSGWRDDPDRCSLLEVKNQCKAELGLE